MTAHLLTVRHMAERKRQASVSFSAVVARSTDATRSASPHSMSGRASITEIIMAKDVKKMGMTGEWYPPSGVKLVGSMNGIYAG